MKIKKIISSILIGSCIVNVIPNVAFAAEYTTWDGKAGKSSEITNLIREEEITKDFSFYSSNSYSNTGRYVVSNGYSFVVVDGTKIECRDKDGYLIYRTQVSNFKISKLYGCTDGKCYIVDTSNGIKKLDSTGKEIYKTTNYKDYFNLWGLIDNAINVNKNNDLVVFDKNNKKLLIIDKDLGNSKSEIQIECDDSIYNSKIINDSLYILCTKSVNNEDIPVIKKYNLDGILELNIEGEVGYNSDKPTYVNEDANGNIWFANKNGNKAYVYDGITGTLLNENNIESSILGITRVGDEIACTYEGVEEKTNAATKNVVSYNKNNSIEQLFQIPSKFKSAYLLDNKVGSYIMSYNIESKGYITKLSISTDSQSSTTPIQPIEEIPKEDVNKEGAYIFKGEGTKDNPYLIKNINDLVGLQKNVNELHLRYYNKYFKMTRSIDLSKIDYWIPIGTKDNPFRGNFDGGNRKIKNLKIIDEINSIQPIEEYIGLFGYVKGNIQNVRIKNGNIKGTNYTGLIVGYIEGNVTHCTAEGKVVGGSYTGGMIGVCNNGVVYQCATDCDVSADTDCLAGVVGAFEKSNLPKGTTILSECISFGKVAALTDTTRFIAGVAYINMNDYVVENCYSSSYVISNKQGESVVSTETDSYASGIITTKESSCIEVKRCLFAGCVENTKSPTRIQPICRARDRNADTLSESEFEDNYYIIDEQNANGTNFSFPAYIVSGIVTSDATGEIAKTNMSNLFSDDDVWITTKKYPMLKWYHYEDLIPTIKEQVITYDLDNPKQFVIDGIVADDTDVINISINGVNHTIDNTMYNYDDGKLTISTEFIENSNVSKGNNYDIQVTFDEGTVVTNKVTLKIIDDTSIPIPTKKPIVEKQTIIYNISKPIDPIVKGIELNGTTITLISLDDEEILDKGEVINNQLKISSNTIKDKVQKNNNYDIRIKFSDGTIITNTVNLKVIEDSSKDTPQSPIPIKKPTVEKQTIIYDIAKPKDIIIEGIELNNTTISSISLDNEKILDKIEVLNKKAKFSYEYIKDKVQKDNKYDIKIKFSDGTVIINTVTLKVIDNTPILIKKPTIKEQTIIYNISKPTDSIIEGIELNDTTIISISLEDKEILKGGEVENGRLVISSNIIKDKVEKDNKYDIKVTFSDGTIIINTITLKVIEDTSDVPIPNEPSPIKPEDPNPPTIKEDKQNDIISEKKEPQKETKKNKKNNNMPKTGDMTKTAPAIIGLLLSLLGMILFKRKENK